MKLQGIAGHESILVPSNAGPFLSAINSAADDRQKRILVKEIERSMLSIEHKLNIARYNAGLIIDLNVEAYMRFRYRHLYPDVAIGPTRVGFGNRCEFTITDLREYRLFLTFFVEAFAAATLSLFDVCAHLLKDLYDIPFSKPGQVDYKNVLQEMKSRDPLLYNFLEHYQAGPNATPWIEPLKGVRNTTTHRPITQVCHLPPDEGDLYDHAPAGEFLLYRTFFPTGSDEVVLKDFVKECFDGLEEFVEDLYEQLRIKTENRNALPLY